MMMANSDNMSNERVREGRSKNWPLSYFHARQCRQVLRGGLDPQMVLVTVNHTLKVRAIGGKGGGS